VNLLVDKIARGLRFAVYGYVEAGDQVSVTLEISGPEIPGSVQLTKIFTFRPGTSTVVRMDDGVDVLALRAQEAGEY
jgi:hypothetical protein